MPVNKIRRLGSFAPLSAHAYKDDALAEAGEAAELLYYRALSFAADVLQDGLITDSQLSRLVGWGMKDTKRRADRLVSTGLWIREDNGYRIRSWLKWNRSLNEIKHLQHKDAGRKAPPPEDPNGGGSTTETPSDRTPNGIQPESDRTGTRVGDGIQRPHTHTEPHTEPKPTSSAPSRDGDLFTEFYDTYPRHTGRKEAQRKWDKAIKDGADPHEVIEGARRFAAVRRGQDPKFTPHPATWLHQGRWADELQQGLRLVANGHQPYQDPANESVYFEDMR